VRETDARTTVTVRGNAAAIAAAFGIQIHNYEDVYGAFTAAPSPIAISDAAAFGLVSGVVGIDGSYHWGTHIARPVRAEVVPFAGTGTQTPADLQSRYNETFGAGGVPAMPGTGQTVAILSTNIPTLTSDLNAFLSQLTPGGVGGPTALANGQYTQVFVGGPNRDTPDQNAYGENVLDPEMVLAMAPYANVVQVFTATNGAGLFADGIAYIVNSLSNAHAVTVSWGTCERGAAGEMPILNALFAQARAEGQQWFFASGDSGTDGCRDGSGNKIKSAGWPASSVNVVGVGGTGVASATTETAWNGAGGGPSESMDKPTYQAGTGVPADSSRDEPDVAAMANPSPGIAYVGNGFQSAIGGTSVAAPLWAGVYAVLVQQKASAGKGLTNALERFYALSATGFHDITTGANTGPGGGAGGYSAGVGYDMVTGLGTPNLTALIANW
jgi:kumamolisin